MLNRPLATVCCFGFYLIHCFAPLANNVNTEQLIGIAFTNGNLWTLLKILKHIEKWDRSEDRQNEV